MLIKTDNEILVRNSGQLLYHIMPSQWKVHKICPVPKGGDRSDVRNYRPISLLCILSKILESLVYDKVIQFIRPKLSKCQFGFLSKMSNTATYVFC